MTPSAQQAGTVSLAGREVNRIGYGLGSLARASSTEERFASGVALLRHALDIGVEFYDTAEFYDNGRANRLLAAAFADRHDQVLYASKVGARPIDGPVPMTAAQKPEELRAALEQNLTTLRTDRIELVYLRRMDMTPGLVIPDDSDQKVPLDDQLAELIRMRDEGLIGAIGLSHVTLDQLQAALPAGITAVSNIYSLVDRAHEPLLRLCEANGIVWAPYFPLGGGQWAGLPKVGDNPVVQDVARSLDRSTNQVGLAWLLAHSPQSLVIAGTSNEYHLDENVESASVRLPGGLLAELDAVHG